MKLRDLFEEMPLQQSPTYTSDWDSSGRTDVESLVNKIHQRGIRPSLEMVRVNDLLATQDWLSDEGGGGDPVFDEYEDYPVALKDNEGYHLLDGHHRVSDAYDQGRKVIKVYVFRL